MAGIESLMNNIRDAVDAELERCATDLLAKAVELAPKETGTLRSSGFVRPNHVSLSHRRFDVVFNTNIITGGNFNYAIIQHEKQFPHKEGQWKFLETPYKAYKDDYRGEVVSVLTPIVSKGTAVILDETVRFQGR